MSKKKSLGSSPIGFQSKDSSMHFIPDLGVSKSNKAAEQPFSTNASQRSEQSHDESLKEEQKTEKKIVSYNLEIALIGKVKSIANKKGMYYSTLVSAALKSWISENG